MADFVVVFTTVPKERLSDEHILELYRLRWQVELHIKRDKSIAGLDQLPNYRPDTIYTWICAKMLLTQIARAIPTPDVAIPPCGEQRTLASDGRRARRASSQVADPATQGRRRTLASHDAGLARDLRRSSAHSAA